MDANVEYTELKQNKGRHERKEGNTRGVRNLIRPSIFISLRAFGPSPTGKRQVRVDAPAFM